MSVIACPKCGKPTTRALCLSCTNPAGVGGNPQLYIVPNVDKFLGLTEVPGPNKAPSLNKFPNGYVNLDHYGLLWYMVRPWYWLYAFRFGLAYLIIPAPYKTYIKVFNEQVLKAVARKSNKIRKET